MIDPVDKLILIAALFLGSLVAVIVVVALVFGVLAS